MSQLFLIIHRFRGDRWIKPVESLERVEPESTDETVEAVAAVS